MQSKSAAAKQLIVKIFLNLYPKLIMMNICSQEVVYESVT